VQWLVKSNVMTRRTKNQPLKGNYYRPPKTVSQNKTTATCPKNFNYLPNPKKTTGVLPKKTNSIHPNTNLLSGKEKG